MAVGGVDDLPQRVVESRIGEPGGNAHGLREVVVTHPEDIHAGSRGDRIQVGEAGGGFDLTDDRGVLVGVLQILGGLWRNVVVVGGSETHSAVAYRRVFHGVHYTLGLLCGFDIADHHA